MHRRARGLWAFVFVACILFKSIPAAAAADWELFTHPTMGFSIRYPSGWETMTADQKSLQMVLLAPARTGSDAHMGVAIAAVRAPANATIDDMLAAADKPLRQEIGKFRILRIDRTTLGSASAMIMYMVGHAREVDLYSMILLTIVQPRLYVVMGFAELNSPQLAEETRLLQSILVTFRPP